MRNLLFYNNELKKFPAPGIKSCSCPRTGFHDAVTGCIRIDMPIWSEGFDLTLPPDFDRSWFEDAIIMTDAVLWLVRQPLDYTGKILTLGELRAQGVVRPLTRAHVR